MAIQGGLGFRRDRAPPRLNPAPSSYPSRKCIGRHTSATALRVGLAVCRDFCLRPRTSGLRLGSSCASDVPTGYACRSRRSFRRQIPACQTTISCPLSAASALLPPAMRRRFIGKISPASKPRNRRPTPPRPKHRLPLLRHQSLMWITTATVNKPSRGALITLRKGASSQGGWHALFFGRSKTVGARRNGSSLLRPQWKPAH